MKKTSVFALLLGLALSADLPAASSNDSSGAQSSANQEFLAIHSGLFYPIVDASYVGGTIFNMPFVIPPWPVRLIEFSPRQYRTDGHIALGSKSVVFIFNLDRKPNPALPAGSLFNLYSCADASPGTDPELACTRLKHSGKKEWWVMDIPYSQIKLLSRAKIGTSDLSSLATVYGTAAAGVLSSVVSAIGKAHGKELYGGITAGGLALGYYFLVARPHAHERYIALFLCHEKDRECQRADAEASDTEAKSLSCDDLCKKTMAEKLLDKDAPGDELFKKGDVVMFKIPNNHDYYNISMILIGKTGQTFVTETTDKGAK